MGDSKQLETQQLEALIAQVEAYQGKLQENIAVLNNAANVCDQAMGSDAICQKYIGQLNEAIEELQKTVQTAADIAKALKADLAAANEVYGSI